MRKRADGRGERVCGFNNDFLLGKQMQRPRRGYEGKRCIVAMPNDSQIYDVCSEAKGTTTGHIGSSTN